MDQGARDAASPLEWSACSASASRARTPARTPTAAGPVLRRTGKRINTRKRPRERASPAPPLPSDFARFPLTSATGVRSISGAAEHTHRICVLRAALINRIGRPCHTRACNPIPGALPSRHFVIPIAYVALTAGLPRSAKVMSKLITPSEQSQAIHQAHLVICVRDAGYRRERR